MYFTIAHVNVILSSERQKEMNRMRNITDNFRSKEAIIMKKFLVHLEELLEAYYKTFA